MINPILQELYWEQKRHHPYHEPQIKDRCRYRSSRIAIVDRENFFFHVIRKRNLLSKWKTRTKSRQERIWFLFSVCSSLNTTTLERLVVALVEDGRRATPVLRELGLTGVK